jgi:class 3 adenylate cyclase
VNTAQRLQTIAQPGQVVVGPSTQLATRQVVSYAALGLVTAKGRELALGCWDRPNECDRAALKREVKKRFRGRGHRHGGRRAHP